MRSQTRENEKHYIEVWDMKRKFKEWVSIQVAKQPRKMILIVILLFNVAFLLLSAVVISSFSLSGTEKMGFLEAAFCTITMILDAGCIQFVVADIGQASVTVALVCICIILVGMVTFTGAVIGYITNYISGFVENANTGAGKLSVSKHVVILNWNTRASEIINDLLYCGQKQTVVVLVSNRKAEIEKEIEERLADTIAKENSALKSKCAECSFLKGIVKYHHEKLKREVTVIVREGDVFSSKQLHDISLEHAKTIIILGNDINNTICKFEHREKLEESRQGNSLTVKTLMLVADITSDASSDDDQKIIVEITDDWTSDLVNKIIHYKQVKEKCNIVPVRVNRVLGQILSQFSLMPELNLAYKELFSNKGATFFALEQPEEEDTAFISRYLETHTHAIPLTFLNAKSDEKTHAYYAAGKEKDITRTDIVKPSDYQVKLNENYWIEKKNVIILGHNSKCRDIMEGFSAFCCEWNQMASDQSQSEILNVIVVDDQKNLEKMEFYREYPFVAKCIPASIYDRELICTTIRDFVSSNTEDTSVLILSDDSALNEDIDANALANLIYVQDIKNEMKHTDPGFDMESIDVIVEIIDPKHHDIVNSYNVNNVVISNRYISKMITQIGAKQPLYDFYSDILTYDTDLSHGYQSKEIYAKKVNRFFAEIPEDTTAAELIRAVYHASTDMTVLPEDRNPAIVLGYVKPGGKMVLFEGDQTAARVHLEENDKIIVYSKH